ncbi:hormogonium polysaccharide secretion pseudopilin HpsB [Cylindrospermopsis curvispora]|uniref:PulG n=1 Tax=Cylindrospermopsis curvispora GIHE-G1 TaxID=2666332 RepID=A0A7H0F2K8_9CYAN|nr:hormogonium polysaccharide secretion pseudopilin HpsB [Cylindrospermopsis curvispora]QNP30274.1 pulG [Cylindrospermopsis curvispora GIHE-G1]
MLGHLKKYLLFPVEEDDGFSILESLVAILTLSLLLMVITPIWIMSTAIRMQSRRVEMAAQAATSFVNGVKTGSIVTPQVISEITPSQQASRNISTSPQDYLITSSEMPAPTSANGLYCYNQNGIIGFTECQNNSNNLFYIQAGTIATSSKNESYLLSIRVFRADIDFTQQIPINKSTPSSITHNLGDKQVPLIQMTTEITNNKTSFYSLCQRLGTIAPTTYSSSTLCQ